MTFEIYYRPRVVSNRCVRVTRKIKGSGKLTVAKNQEVSPHDILGSSLIQPGFTIINIAKELKCSPSESVKCLKKTVGVPVYKGELLAQKKSLFSHRSVLSPTDCIIEKINQQTGELTLKMLPKQSPLLSGLFGIVDDINSITGEVHIKTMATQIYGVFGSGRERGGFLRFVGGRADLIDVNQLNPSQNGDILVAGGLVFGLALKKAMEYQIDGLISGGFNMDDYLSIAGSLYESHKSHSDIGMSLVATEGYGPLSLGSDIYQTLEKFEGKFVFINGFNSHVTLPDPTADAIVRARKIALPPLSVSNAVLTNKLLKTAQAGQKVRLIRAPFAASQGEIISIDQTPSLLPSGLTAICALVELAHKKIKIPLSNLELIN
jgi:hypothetical protein